MKRAGRGLAVLPALPVVVAVLLGASPPAAARPEALTAISPKTVLATWTGLPFAGLSVAGPGKCPLATDPLDVLCDHFSLKVNAPARYWQGHVGGTSIGIAWTNARNDFDLYVLNANRRLVASSALHRTTSEAVFVPRARGAYEIRVVPHHVVSSGYVGSAGFISVPAAPKRPEPMVNPGSDVATSVVCGASGRICFDPRVDRISWFWGEQIDQAVRGKGAANVGRRIRLPSPQAKDTLPVAVTRGRVDKTAAVAFDLAKRGVTGAFPISNMVLTVVEAPPPDAHGSTEGVPEFPSMDEAAARIEACPIAAAWQRGDAEPMAAQPRLAGEGCAPGRRVRAGRLTEWRFDLSGLGSASARAARTNQGVLLRGVPHGPGASNTWQVNLKVPRGDDPSSRANEYRETRTRAWLEADTPQAETRATVPSPPANRGSRFEGLAGRWRVAPSRVASNAGSGPDRTVPVGATGVAAARPGPLSKIPWYVWLLPVEILAVASARWLLLQRSAGSGPSRGAGELE